VSSRKENCPVVLMDFHVCPSVNKCCRFGWPTNCNQVPFGVHVDSGTPSALISKRERLRNSSSPVDCTSGRFQAPLPSQGRSLCHLTPYRTEMRPKSLGTRGLQTTEPTRICPLKHIQGGSSFELDPRSPVFDNASKPTPEGTNVTIFAKTIRNHQRAYFPGAIHPTETDSRPFNATLLLHRWS